MTTKNKIYPAWAYTENEEEKRKSNKLALAELKEKYKIVNQYYYKTFMSDEEKENVDVVYDYYTGYGNKTYFITKNKPKLTTLELALICDDGNLCFGFDVTTSGIKIYTD